MRFFIALEIPEKNKSQLQSIQQKLHKLIPQARITNLEKIHLTLAFIGERPNNLKDSLVQVIQNAGQGISSFEATPAYIDGFPSLHHPLVLWVGVKGDIDKILLIRERVKDELSALHLATDERRFIPHITIAKLNHFKVSRSLEVELEKIMAQSFDPITISSIKLFDSVAQNGFHRHNTLAETKLV